MKRLTKYLGVFLAGVILASPVMMVLPLQNEAQARIAPIRSTQQVKSEQTIAWDDPASPYRMIIYGTPPTNNYAVILDMALATSANLSALIADGRVRFFQVGTELAYYITSNATPSTATFVVNVASNTTGHWEMYWGGPAGNHQSSVTATVGTTDSHIRLYEPLWAETSTNWTSPDTYGSVTYTDNASVTPVWSKSGRTFDGVNDLINVSGGAVPLTSNFTFFARASTNVTNIFEIIFESSNNTNSRWDLLVDSAARSVFQTNNGTTSQRFVVGVAANTVYDFMGTLSTNSTDAQVKEVWRGTTSSNGGGGSSTIDGSGQIIGARVGAYFWSGNISDIIVYDSILNSTTNQSDIYNQMNWRHVPSNITYSSTSTVVSTVSATFINSNSALLTGSLTSMGSDTSVNMSFEWGTSNTSLTNNTPITVLSDIGTFTANLSGLSSNTKYYFRASANGTPTGSYATGNILSFRTAFIISDYYYGFTTDNGSLSFTNKATGANITSNAPTFYMSYGSSTTNVSPLNSSFEVGNPPSNWTLTGGGSNTTWNGSGTHVFDGAQSLKLSMNGTQSINRLAYSSSISVNQDKSYSITTHSYVESSVTIWDSLSSRIYVVYYTTTDGTGTAYFDSYITPSTTIGAWDSQTLTWYPPPQARSFRIVTYEDARNVRVLYYDAISVIEVSPIYRTNGAVTSTVTTSGDNVTVTSTDNTSANVTVSNRYDLNLHTSTVTYNPTITRTANLTVDEERFDFNVPSVSATIMTRDMALISFNASNTYYNDHLSPRVLKFTNGLQFLATDNMDSMRVRSLDGLNTQVTYYANYYRFHPADIGSSENVSANSSYSPSITFYIDPGTTLKSLVPTRQPNGYDATLFFTDHADNSNTAATAAVGLGTENTGSLSYGVKGIVGNGLGWTKSVFAYTQPAAIGLDNAGYKSVIDALYARGTEVILHTPSDIADNSSVVSTALTYMDGIYHSHNWIDHNSATNFEDIAANGTIKGGAYYILDLLNSVNITYAWSYHDYAGENLLNMLSPSTTYSIIPWFYKNSNISDNIANTPIYLWSSTNTNKNPENYYTQADVDSLISQRGIHIGHEYMSFPTNQNHAWWINGGTYEVFPAFETELEYIKSKVTSQQIWSPTMTTAGDWWRLLANISVERLSSQIWKVTNNNATALPAGLTLLYEDNVSTAATQTAGTLLYGGVYGAKEIVFPTSIAAGQSVNVLVNFTLPSVTTGTVTNVGMNGGTHATLNAEITSMGVATDTYTSFQYSTDLSFSQSTPEVVQGAIGTYSATITGFLPNQFYNVRAVNRIGSVSTYGATQTFFTNATATFNLLDTTIILVVVALIFFILSMMLLPAETPFIFRMILIAVATYFVLAILPGLQNILSALQ